MKFKQVLFLLTFVAALAISCKETKKDTKEIRVETLNKCEKKCKKSCTMATEKKCCTEKKQDTSVTSKENSKCLIKQTKCQSKCKTSATKTEADCKCCKS